MHFSFLIFIYIYNYIRIYFFLSENIYYSFETEMTKYKTVRLFGVNLECRTFEAQEDSISDMKAPTPDHGCFTTKMVIIPHLVIKNLTVR